MSRYNCFRLTRGMNLKKEIGQYAIDNKVSNVIHCVVGCLNKLVIRLADGNSILEKKENFEIVSITGTLSSDGVHIHIAVSDDLGNTIEGHLKVGCIVNTTSEVCLKIFDNVKLNREYNESTGYDELVIYER